MDSRDGAPADEAPIWEDSVRMPSDWAIDWQFFIDLEHGAEPAETAPLFDRIVRKPQKAYKIDTSLVSPLRHLPHRIASNPSMLALRNLQRGAAFGLPSGQDVARALGEGDPRRETGDRESHRRRSEEAPDRDRRRLRREGSPVGLHPVRGTGDILGGRPGMTRDDIPIKLGPVGGRIVAEVFAALLRSDPTSYLNEGAGFTPIAAFHARRKVRSRRADQRRTRA